MNSTLKIHAATTLLLMVTSAHADEADCRVGREKAAGQYAACLSKAKVQALADETKAQNAFSTCRGKYAAAWDKLKIKNPGTACDAVTRFVDNTDGTVTDHLTGLVWEKKDSPGGSSSICLDGTGSTCPNRHDVDNSYMWNGLGLDDYEDGDGSIFTDFLATLNAGAGFAGTNDWRLPTVLELQTILLPEEYPCAIAPCTYAELGPDAGLRYWTSTSPAGNCPTCAWTVSTHEGYSGGSSKGFAYRARAVRNGP